MAPIKFEEQLKDKLEKRSLQPSADSWAKLSERLDAQEKNSRSPWFWWMGIAAGVAIMIFLAIQNFGPENDENVSPHLVEENKIEQIIESKTPNVNKIETIELVVEDENNQ